MTKSFPNKSTTEAKSVNWSEVLGSFHKKHKLTDKDVEKAAKNAKKGYIAVKTRNSGGKEPSFDGFRHRVLEKTPYKPTSTVLNPNEAFRHKKGDKQVLLDRRNPKQSLSEDDAAYTWDFDEY